MFNIFKSYKDEEIQLKRPTIPLFILVTVFFIGTAGYSIIWKDLDTSIIDRIYMTFVTITTIGYSEVHPLDTGGRIFTMIIAVAGIGSLFYVLSMIMEDLFIIQLYNIRGKRKMVKRVEKLSNHIILVGHGRVGRITANELLETNEDFVVIEEQFDEEFKALEHKKLHIVEGDATEDSILRKAGVERARGIIVTTARKSTTVFVVLSAKVLNPNLYVVARADEETAIEKLKKAGADKIVNPYSTGGMRLAQQMVNPHVVKFMDSSVRSGEHGLSIENITLPDNCSWVGKSFIDLDIRKKTGANIIAVIRDKEPIVNPAGDFQLQLGDRLVAMGNKDQTKNLEKLVMSNS